MRAHRRFLFGGLGALVLALLALTVFLVMQATAGGSGSASKDPFVFQYAAKFFCGTILTQAQSQLILFTDPLAPGTYTTDINIHNPNNFPVTIQKKFVQSPPPAETIGRPSERFTLAMDPDTAFQIDCKDITAKAPCLVLDVLGFVLFCKGYVVIECGFQPPGKPFILPCQLDVTDVITVKEQHGLWKDYTFIVRCLLVISCQALGFPFCQATDPVSKCRPLNWPDWVRDPEVSIDFPVSRQVPPLCYGDSRKACPLSDVDQLIRARLLAECLKNTAGTFCSQITDPNAIGIDLINVDFATDSRDVDLDFEFVTSKRVNYPCWPLGTPACPQATPTPTATPPPPTPTPTPPPPTPTPTPCVGAACPTPTPTATPTATPKTALDAGGRYDGTAPGAPCCVASGVTVTFGPPNINDLEFVFAAQNPPWTGVSNVLPAAGWTCPVQGPSLLRCVRNAGTLIPPETVVTFNYTTTTGNPPSPCQIVVHATQGGNNLGTFAILPAPGTC